MPTLSLFGLIATLACALNLTLIATLPTVLFKPGVRRFAWWLTASPLILAGGGLVVGTLGGAGVTLPPQLQGVAAPLGATLAFGSMSLIRWAGRAHHSRLALWHQEDDRPEELVTWGPYRHIRHPLYTAFLLTLVACFMAVPGWATGLALLGGLVQLNRTAAREERRMAASSFGQAYSQYVARTGRFLPLVRTGI